MVHSIWLTVTGPASLVAAYRQGEVTPLRTAGLLVQAAQLDLRQAPLCASYVSAEGVCHLHLLGIAHRDLKPQNLMYLSPPEAGGQASG